MPRAENAAEVRSLLKIVRRYTEADHAGLSVLLAPCPNEMAVAKTAIGSDPPGVDRIKVHEAPNRDAEGGPRP